MRDLRRVGWGRIADVAIFVGLLVSGFGQLAWGDTNGPIWANAILMTAIALPALWRRSHAELAFSASMTAVLVVTLGYYPSGTDGPGESWFGFLIMTFSLALYGEGRALVAATLYGVAAFATSNVGQLVVGTGPFDVFTAWVFPLVAWLGGRALHHRQSAAERHRRRADEAEQRREEDARRAVELERARIARELHDMISHSVSVIVMQASVERRLLGESEPRTSDALLEIERAGRSALDELRALLGVLRDSGEGAELQPQPSLEQLPALVERVRAAGLPVELRIEGERVKLPPAIELSGYRIVQEGLTNVVKHAGSAQAAVDIRYEPDRLVVEVRDNGTGANGTASGSGLAGLRERVGIYGGTIDATSPEGGGFVLRASLPTSIGTS